MIKKGKIRHAKGAGMLQILLPYIFALALFSALLLPFAFPQYCYSAQTTLTWDVPTTNADGTAFTDLSGFKIHYGTASGNYSQTIDVGDVTSSTVSNLTAGTTYYFAVAAYDASGIEGDYSNEVSKTIQYSLTVFKSGTSSGTITSSAGGINCGASCAAYYNAGTVVTLTALPSAGSTFTGWSGGGCSGTGTCSLSMNSNLSVTAQFVVNTYTITATAGGDGTISPAGSVTVNSGTNNTFKVMPNSGYHILDVKVDGASVGAVATYTFSNVTANHTIAATFAINTYGITATAGGGGTISPSGAVIVNMGTNKAFTVAPNTGYAISNVNVDGVSIGAVSSYSFNNINSSHSISVTFKLVCGSQPVKDGSTYYSSIQSAYDAAQTGAGLLILGTSLNETPDLSRDIDLTLLGGYDCSFSDSSLYSTITGGLVISGGSVTIDNIIIL